MGYRTPGEVFSEATALREEDPGEVAVVAVGTPPARESAVNLRQVRAAMSWVKSMIPNNLVIAMKSTVPPGAGLELMEQDLAGTGIGYVANPEFLREGQAVSDWDRPDRIVIGALANDFRSVEALKRLYAGVDAPLMVTDITSAEMVKYASNAFLATRISFINEIAALCQSLGASIDDVSQGLALDSRTGAVLPDTDDFRGKPERRNDDNPVHNSQDRVVRFRS